MPSKKNNPAQRAASSAKSAVRLANAPAKSGNSAGGKSAKPQGTPSAKAAAKTVVKPTAKSALPKSSLPKSSKLKAVNDSGGKQAAVKVVDRNAGPLKTGSERLGSRKSGNIKSATDRASMAKPATVKPATVKASSVKVAAFKAASPTAAASASGAAKAKPGPVKPSLPKTAVAKKTSSKVASAKVIGALGSAEAMASVDRGVKSGNTNGSKRSHGPGSSDRGGRGPKADRTEKPNRDAVPEKRRTSEGKSRATAPTIGTRNGEVARQIQDANEQRERQRDLSQPLIRSVGTDATPTEAVRDRVVLLVRDPYWLQASWEITRQSVQRAQAAMAEQWHSARPILRVFEVENAGMTSSAERLVREIAIHGGVHNWYIDVQNPPRGFRVEIGYLSTLGKFFAIARSNIVSTPRPGSADSLDENWSDVEENYERIFAQSGGYSEETNSHELQEAFEERLQRPIGPPLASRFGVGAERILRRKRDFQFDVDAEMVVHGQTKPDAHVTLSGEPVKLRADGSFAVRMAMPDKRQVIPVVASSRDGVEQRTIVIAVERNTKVMEPMIRESNE